MSNIASALKEEVTRIARKEIRNETVQLKKAAARYRADIADLKRRLANAEQAVTRMLKASEKSQATVSPTEHPTGAGIRFSAKGFRTMRERLGMSGSDAAKLLCVSVQTIYNWESESSKPRQPQLAAIAVLRKAGKREVAAKLLELNA